MNTDMQPLAVIHMPLPWQKVKTALYFHWVLLSPYSTNAGLWGSTTTVPQPCAMHTIAAWYCDIYRVKLSGEDATDVAHQMPTNKQFTADRSLEGTTCANKPLLWIQG